MSNNQEEPFLLSDYQMYEIKKLTKQLEEIRKTIKARNNFINYILHVFQNPYPIDETHEKVYHVSGFRPLIMFKILFGDGLKWMRGKGIFYNTTEFCLRHLTLRGHIRGAKRPREHVSVTHARAFYRKGSTLFKAPSLRYLRRFGRVPLIVTYEINTVGFRGGAKVYDDIVYIKPPTDDNGEEYSIFRYVQQDSIPSKYIRLKAITFALPIFGWYKVLWRRKSD